MNELSTDNWKETAGSVVRWLDDWLRREAEDPVLEPMRGVDLKSAFDESLPRRGRPIDDVLSQLETHLLPGLRKNGHPRFMAYVSSSSDPVGALADLIASALNQNVTSWRSAPAAATIERQTLAWLDQALGFDGSGHGLCLGGGSAANFHAVALGIAHGQRTGDESDRRRLCVYWTAETHLSLPKAARILGILPENIRVAPSADAAAQTKWLTERVRADRASGLVPCLICGTAGTAGTGTVEPLHAFADLAGAQDLWFHVDGAYGAPAALLDEQQELREAFARADSISIDPHKWLFAPIDIACLLVRDPTATRALFSEHADYTQVTQTESAESFAFFDHSLELSRRFRALKLWMILKLRGLDAITDAIRRNIQLRERLDEAVDREPALELLASGLSISCFRYLGGNKDPREIELLNERIMQRLNEEGAFHLSPNRVGGEFTLRACIVNFRTTADDVDRLVADILRLGSELEKSD